jgi:hypothetical protein
MLYSKQKRGRMAPFSFVMCLDLAAIQPAAGFELIRKQMTIQQAKMMSFHICVTDTRSGTPVARTSIIEFTCSMEYFAAMEQLWS